MCGLIRSARQDNWVIENHQLDEKHHLGLGSCKSTQHFKNHGGNVKIVLLSPKLNFVGENTQFKFF